MSTENIKFSVEYWMITITQLDSNQSKCGNQQLLLYNVQFKLKYLLTLARDFRIDILGLM